MSGGGGSQNTVTEKTIPDFLKPFVTRQAQVGTGALDALQGLLSGQLAQPQQRPQTGGSDGRDRTGGSDGRDRTGFSVFPLPQGGSTTGGPEFDPRGLQGSVQGGIIPGTEVNPADVLVTPFNQDQQDAIDLARDRAGGQGGFIPTAQQQFLQTAQGTGGLPIGQEGLNQLRGTAAGLGGVGGSGVSRLNQLAFGGGGIGQQGVNQLNQTAVSNGGIGQQGVDQLNRTAFGGGNIGQQGVDQLNRTASGSFLESPGFQNSFEAAVRRAQPRISSAFSLGGRSGSGLESVAQTQAASDAFAGLFNAERGRQVSAGQTLSGLGENALSRQLSASGTLSGLGENALSRQLSASGTLSGLGENALSRQLSASGTLSGLSNAERQRQIASGAALSDLSNAERTRQLGAAQALPDFAFLEPDILQQIGLQQQQQQQQVQRAPLTAQEILLNAAGGSLNLNSLTGQSSTQPVFRNRTAGALGGAASGGALGGAAAGASGGSVGGPVGVGVGAVLGGLLGAFA